MLVAGSKVVLTAREVGRGLGMLWLDQPGLDMPQCHLTVTKELYFDYVVFYLSM